MEDPPAVTHNQPPPEPPSYAQALERIVDARDRDVQIAPSHVSDPSILTAPVAGDIPGVRPVSLTNANSAVTYSFRPHHASATLVVPESTAPDPRPAYHISTGLDCFDLKKIITTIVRGGSDEGEIVAFFESKAGQIQFNTFFTLHGKSFRISEVSHLQYKPATWVMPHVKFTWTKYSETEVHCYLGTQEEKSHLQCLLATFSRGFRFPKLFVTPKGQEYLDDIVLSILLCERHRSITH